MSNRCSSALDLPFGCTVILRDGRRVVQAHLYCTYNGEPLFEGLWYSPNGGPRTVEFFSDEVDYVIED